MKFHDEDYDGVVIKLPRWFIEMNHLEPAIEQLHNVLKECKLSMYHPDHTHNLHELENFREKKEMIDEIKKDAKQKEENRKSELKRLYAGEEFNLEWTNIRCLFDSAFDTDFKMLDDSRFDSTDIFTKKGIKTTFEKLFREQIKTLDDLQKLAKKNFNVKLLHLLEGCDESAIDMNYSLFYSRQGWDVLGITINRLCVCHSLKETRDGYNYRYVVSELIKYDDGVLGYKYGNNLIRLEGFKRKGLKLVKE